MAIVAIIVGCIAIVCAFVSKNFYSADIYGGSVGDKPIHKLLGRSLFVGVGIFMIICGITSLVSHPPSTHFNW